MIGTLRHLITIKQQVLPDHSAFDQTPHDEDYATVWASVEDLQGREVEYARAIHAETTTRFIIRYLPGLTTSMRIYHNDKCYEILAIIDKEHRMDYLTILAKVTT